MKVTIFKNATEREVVVEFSQVVDAIKFGTNQNKLFAPSGIISISGRKKNTLIYSGLVLLMFDANSDEEMNMLFQCICEMSTTYCCFRNHLGNGLNVLVKTDCLEGHHKTGYQQVVEAYQENLNLKVLIHQSNEHVLCHLSQDPHIYINSDSITFKVEIITRKYIVTDIHLNGFYRSVFEEQVKLTEMYIKLSNETWNDFFGTLANNCYKIGIPYVLTLEFVWRSYKLNDAVKGIIKRIYQGKSGRMAKDSIFSLLFNRFSCYHPEVKADERIFFEALVYKSITIGIPFYYAADDVIKELGIKRTRRESIEEKFKKMGLLYVYTKKVKEEDTFEVTHYQLIMSNYEEAVQNLRTDASFFISKTMRLLIKKDNSTLGYYLK